MNVARDIAAFISNQAGNPLVETQPVGAVGCRDGILLIYQALLGDGMPTWVFQQLDEGFLKKLQTPYSTLYAEWSRQKPWPLPFDVAITRYEKRMAGNQTPQRLDGVSAFVVDSETLLPIRTAFVDKTLVDTLSKGCPLPVAPLIAAAADGAVIGFMYEREPKQYVMRVERIPDEETIRLGLARVGEATVDIVRGRLIDHIRTVFAGPIPADAPSA